MTGRLGPSTWVNVFYFAVDAGSHTPGEVIAAVAEYVHDFYEDIFGFTAFPTSWSTTWCTVTYRDAADSTVRVRVSDVTPGTGSELDEDAQVAYLINWATADPRRGGKPRQYVSGVDSAKMADSAFLSNTFLAAINPRFITWLEEDLAATIPLQLVEMSFRDGNTWRDAAHTYPIIGGSLNPVVATQRRRVNRLRPAG